MPSLRRIGQATMDCDVCIVGAGPGGLSCAKILAQNGVRVILLERNLEAGNKVCAGGVTWDGLLDTLPSTIIERMFSVQHISTPWQHVKVTADHPLIGTVNRRCLGDYLAQQAAAHGARLIFGARALNIEENKLIFRLHNKEHCVRWAHLVGADGSHSTVRASIGLASSRIGIGLNYTIPGQSAEMVWNFDYQRFRSGYSWIFPHRDSISVGAYCGAREIPATKLRNALNEWLKHSGIAIEQSRLRADLINHDYRGWRFGNRYLIGDAAGLASPLTGEGIFPAVVSGEAAANSIINQPSCTESMKRLLKQHRRHRLMLSLSTSGPAVSRILVEVCAALLRSRLIPWKLFEMA